MYQIAFEENAVDDLAGIRPFDGRRILDAIQAQLKHEPGVETRHRKVLAGVEPPWNAVPPIWELRIGDYRVFYDVNDTEKKVYVRAIRHKPPHKATEEIL